MSEDELSQEKEKKRKRNKITDSKKPILGSKIFAIPKSPNFSRPDCIRNMFIVLMSLYMKGNFKFIIKNKHLILNAH